MVLYVIMILFFESNCIIIVQRIKQSLFQYTAIAYLEMPTWLIMLQAVCDITYMHINWSKLYVWVGASWKYELVDAIVVLTRWEYSKDEALFWKVSLPYKLLYTRSAIAICHRQKIMQNRGTHQVHAFTEAFSKN